MLGRFLALRDGEEIPPSAFRQRLVRTLVRVLVSRRGEFISRDVLTEALWPRRAPDDPGANLRVLVTLARRALGEPSLVLTGPGGYVFVEDKRCRVDAEVFLDTVAAARDHLAGHRPGEALRTFRAALRLWGGEPLAEDAYAAWAQDYRRHLHGVHMQALEGATAAALAMHNPGEAIVWAEQAVAKEPLREPSQLLLVEALAAAGDTAGALATYEDFRRRLAEELGLDPSPDAAELQSRILRGELAGIHARRRAMAPAQATGADLAFVDREGELEVILATLQRGVTAVTSVSGPSGSGKTRLLAEVAARCEVPFVSVRAFLPEEQEAWALGRSLLREALTLDLQAAHLVPDRAAQALADVLPELADVRPVDRGPLDAESRRALAMEGGIRLLEAVAPGGVLVLVDDLQWADDTSLALLGSLTRRIPRLDLVVAYREEEVDPGSPVATFLQDLPSMGTEVLPLRLGPLPAEAISELIADEELAAAIDEETDRTPMVVANVVNDLVTQGAIELDSRGRWRPRTPDAGLLARKVVRTGRRRAVATRIRHQPEARRQTLSLLALLGREAPARLLSEARRTGQDRVLKDLESLARAGLVRLGDGGWAATHELIGEVAVEGLDPAERGRLHGLLAAALNAEAGDPAELARHLVGAGDTGAAAEAFVRAGRRSLESFASDQAERLAEAGLKLDPEPAVRAQLLDIRAEGRTRKGDLQGARDDLRLVLQAIAEGPARSRVLSRMAMVVSAAEDLIHAAALIDVALMEAGDDEQARAEALAVGSILDVNTNQVERAEQRTAEARALFEKVGDTEGVARTMDAQAMAVLAHGRIFQAVDMLGDVARLFHDAGMLLRVGTTRGYRALALVWANRPGEALEEAERGLELERILGHQDEVLCLGIRGLALAGLGRTEEARRSTNEGLEMARRLRHRAFTAAAFFILGVIARGAGETDAAEANFRESLDVASGMPIYTSWAAANLALLLIERGDLAQAEQFVRRAMDDAGIPLTQYEPRLAQVELAIARHDPEAMRLAAHALALAESGGHMLSAVRLRELIEAGAA